MQHQVEMNASTVELARYFKVALADKNNISFENAEYILKYFAKDGIPEVIDDACLWLDCFEEKCFTVLTEDIDNMPQITVQKTDVFTGVQSDNFLRMIHRSMRFFKCSILRINDIY